MKYILLILTLNQLLLTSCNNDADLQKEVVKLKSQNDSLRNELQDYEKRYVFKNVLANHYAVKGSRVEKNKTYSGEFVFIPQVVEDLVEIRITSKNQSIIDTLSAEKGHFGAYPFEIDIIDDTTNINFKPIIKSEISLKHQNAGYNGIIISDKLIVK